MKNIITVEEFNTNFGVESLDICLSEYADGSGQGALVSYHSVTKEPWGAFTVNLDDYGVLPRAGNLIISNYAENEGIVEELMKHGIVSSPIQTFYFGVGRQSSAHEVVLLMGAEDHPSPAAESAVFDDSWGMNSAL